MSYIAEETSTEMVVKTVPVANSVVESSLEQQFRTVSNNQRRALSNKQCFITSQKSEHCL